VNLAILAVLCGLFGLAIGSFLNVVIYRVPRGLSVLRPRSACPTCDTPIAERDNIPLLSWVLLRGRCRHCSSPISPRYPAVELACGLGFAVVALKLGTSWALPAYCLAVAGLLALAVIDAELLRLPTPIVWSTTALVVVGLTAASALEPNWRALWVAAACAAGWFVVFFAIHALSPRLIGFGDVRLAPLLGFSLGWLSVWTAVAGFFLANVVGLLLTLGLMALGRASRSTRVPYGVFLALGWALAFCANPALAHFFERLFSPGGS